MKYFLTIGGVNFDFLRITYEREASIESKTAEILIAPARLATLPAIGDAVVISKQINNGTPLVKWQGKVEMVQNIPLPNNTIKVIAYDLKYKVNFNNVKNSGYASSKGSTIFTAEVETPAVTDLTLGTVETTDAVLDTVSLGKSISGNDSKVTRSTSFEIIQILGDSDVYIQRDGTANYLRDAGTDRSSTHILEHGLNGTLMPDIGYSEDETRRVKQVIVKGAGVGTNFILGAAGTPATTDKVKQIELPFVPSNATAQLAAQTILNELDKTNKFAKFRLESDLFQTNYDVFDTVKLKARLPHKIINENLKIFSIKTIVSNGLDDLHEVVELELQNFERAQLAKMLSPIKVTQNNLATIKTGISFTQADRNSFPLLVNEQITSTFENTVASGLVDVATLGTFSSDPTMGAYVTIGVRMIIRKKTNGVIAFQFGDGTDLFPTGSNRLVLQIPDDVGDVAYDSFTFYIPKDVAGLTITLKALLGTTGEVEVKGRSFMESIGG